MAEPLGNGDSSSYLESTLVNGSPSTNGNGISSETSFAESVYSDRIEIDHNEVSISPKEYPCHSCSSVFHNHFQLNSHMRKHKAKKGSPSSKSKASLPRKYSSPKNYHNLHNGQGFRLWQQRKKTNQEKRNETETISTNGNQNATNSKHRIQPKLPFACNQCEFRAKTKLSVDLHVRLIHEGITAHKCLCCWKSFPTSGLLSYHTDKEHSSDLSQQKDKCNVQNGRVNSEPNPAQVEENGKDLSLPNTNNESVSDE